MTDGQRTVRLLLVEDNQGDVRLVQKALKQWSVAVDLTVATDGEEAAALLDAHRGDGWLPDLILLDLNLPKLDGRELLARIKKDPDFAHIPVIVLTSSTNDADILSSYRLHANCYLNKPADFRTFVETMRAVHDFWVMAARLPRTI